MWRASSLALATGLCLAPINVHAAQPDPRDEQIRLLKQQLQALTEKVEALEGKVAAQAPAQPAAARVTIAAGKPRIASADGRFTASLHGVMQFDAADYRQRTPGPIASDFRRGAGPGDAARARDLSSGSNFRRARIGVGGKAFGDWDYNLLFDFGGAGEEDGGHIQELWLQYSGLRPFHARIGAFAPSVGLEDQASTNGALFLERPAISDMSRGLGGGDYREAAMLWAAGRRWYAAASVTGRTVGVARSQASSASQPFDSSLAYIGRVAVVPLQGDGYMLHLGLHGTWVARPADAGGPDAAPGAVRYGVTFQERPELRVDGTRLISTGAIDARHASELGLEVAGQWGGLFLQSEFERLKVDRRPPTALSDPRFDGFYVEGSYILTGERRRYNPNTFAFDAPPVDHPFSWDGEGWGAFEIAGRYSLADLNYHQGAPGRAPAADAVRGGEQRIIAAGLNWYPNTFVRFLLDYQDVRIRRLSPSATAFMTPVGAQVGQHYHVVSLRSQFSF
jgi:phosphate-selective porin OprO/OprP